MVEITYSHCRLQKLPTCGCSSKMGYTKWTNHGSLGVQRYNIRMDNPMWHPLPSGNIPNSYFCSKQIIYKCQVSKPNQIIIGYLNSPRTVPAPRPSPEELFVHFLSLILMPLR